MSAKDLIALPIKFRHLPLPLARGDPAAVIDTSFVVPVLWGAGR